MCLRTNVREKLNPLMGRAGSSGIALTATWHVTTASTKQLIVAGLLVKSESAGLVNWKNSTQGSLICLKASIHKNLKHLTKVGHGFFSFKGTLALCSWFLLKLSVNANTRGFYILKARHKSKRKKRLRGKLSWSEQFSPSHWLCVSTKTKMEPH